MDVYVITITWTLSDLSWKVNVRLKGFANQNEEIQSKNALMRFIS